MNIAKNIFFYAAMLLLLSSLITWYFSPSRQTGKPVLVWQTGICPERYEQVELFRKWMRNEGYVDQKGEPLFDIKIQAAGNQSTLIQAVSGVGGDIIDSVNVKRFGPMGILEDITDFAKANQMDPSSNYLYAGDLLMHLGRQYAYACNLCVNALVVNLDTFQKYNVTPPPESWTPEEFERLGKEFVAKANKGRERQEIFFCESVPFVQEIARSLGADVFNETLTHAKLNTPEFIKAFELQHKWIYVDHLMPSAAEQASENTAAAGGSFGGNSVSNFIHGRYAMIRIGRYINMNLRLLPDPIRTAMIQQPMFEFKNLPIYARSSAVYKGGKHKDFAKLFLKFLASREYNELIINGSDGLPPNPKYAMGNPEYLKPSRHPNEGNVHENELKWARTIALPAPYSPYYPMDDIGLTKALEKYMAGRATPAKALAEYEKRINNLIQDQIKVYDNLKKDFDEQIRIQAKIDALKQEGKKIPKSWIRNPFHLLYYKTRGMLDETK